MESKGGKLFCSISSCLTMCFLVSVVIGILGDSGRNIRVGKTLLRGGEKRKSNEY